MAKPQNVSSIPLSLANWFRGHWRSPTKETPVLHLLVGSLEDWWFLMHFLELGNGNGNGNGVPSQFSNLLVVRNSIKDTTVLHLLVGSLEVWWFLMHFLGLGNAQEVS